MKVLRSSFAFLVGVCISSAALAQHPGGLQPASAGDIAGAVTDCWNAVGMGAVDRAKLEAAGWRAATVTNGKGKALASSLGLYGKAGGNALLIVAEPSPSQISCSVVASLPSAPDVGKALGTTQKALLALDPQVKAARSGNDIAFIALPKLALASVTGSKEKPGVRIVVGYQHSEKK